MVRRFFAFPPLETPMAFQTFLGSAAQNAGITNPADDAVPVVPNDGVDLVDGVCSSLYIGVAGTLRVTTRNNVVRDFAAVAAGVLPIRAKRVHATSTTATGIIALYHVAP
jgi:hypothetical protein